MADLSNLSMTRSIATRSATCSFDELPSDILTIAKHCLLDWIGVTVAGCGAPLVGFLVEEAREEGGVHRATLLGSGTRVGSRQAALINGAAGHVLDFDDVHLASRVHPSAVLWPAVLAVAEERGLHGRHLIAAFVAGVEAQCRIAAQIGDEHYRLGWHNTATLGTFGAAVAVCNLLRATRDEVCHALGIAATQAAGLRVGFGTMCKPFHAGHAAAAGILSARLATRGFKSPPDILECVGGFAATYGNQSVRPYLDKGREYFSTREIIFKYHASCYGTHAPIEAALRLASRIRNCTNKITRIAVTVEPQYLSVCDIPEPSTPTEAQFSIRHAVALALSARDTSGLASFSVQAIQDVELARLRRITTVIGSDAIARANAELVVTMDDGATLVERVDASVPEKDLLQQRARLEAKFHTLLSPLIAVDRRERVVESCRRLEGMGDLRGMLSNCRIDRRTANSRVARMRDAVTVE